ncbi:MAG: nucleotide exchange factor GrpE [Parcubacteria group bacterium]|jgi:molecular chaperone GrpE
MTKKKEKEEDIIEQKDIEKEAAEEVGRVESEEEIEKIDKKVHEELIKTADKYLDNWKRCQANFENYKKRQVKDSMDLIRYSNENLIMQIIPVLDNFNASLAHVPEDKKDNAWVTGITYIKKQLEDILKNNGVDEVEVKAGDKFNPEIHEAIKQESEKDGQEFKNKIMKVAQNGYKINGKVIRPARVVVE